MSYIYQSIPSPGLIPIYVYRNRVPFPCFVAGTPLTASPQNLGAKPLAEPSPPTLAIMTTYTQYMSSLGQVVHFFRVVFQVTKGNQKQKCCQEQKEERYMIHPIHLFPPNLPAHGLVIHGLLDSKRIGAVVGVFQERARLTVRQEA